MQSVKEPEPTGAHCQRRGAKRAAVAVEHSIHVIFSHMMRTGEPYHEKGVEYFHNRAPEAVERQLVKRLKCLGYQVTAPPTL